MTEQTVSNPSLGKLVFENDNYAVTIGRHEDGEIKCHGGTYRTGYLVTNKETGVVEVATVQLPDAIASAEQLDIAMTEQAWKWVRINYEAELLEEEPGGPIH